MRFAAMAALVCNCLFLSGCPVNVLPVPHLETTISEFDGIIMDDGESVVDQIVILRWGRIGKGKWEHTSETKTSETGRFHFSGKSRFMPVMIVAVVADREFSYQLALGCPEEEGETVIAEKSFLYGTIPPKRFNVKCDLSKTTPCIVSLD